MFHQTVSVVLGGLLLSTTVSAAATTGAKTPIVKIDAGEVHGGFCKSSSTKLYQGIPFAEPPVGKLRFMPPKKLEGSYPGGKLDATKPPNACIQWPSPFDVDGATSEDWYVVSYTIRGKRPKLN